MAPPQKGSPGRFRNRSAFEVATALDLPLDVFVVRNLGFPGHEEFAIGALASGGVRIVDEDVVRMYRISQDEVDAITAREQVELDRRERQYRDDRAFPEIQGKTVILVDDGLATGSTMRVAIKALRMEAPARIVVAVPVSSPETCDALRGAADEVVCAMTPEPFVAVGIWYDDFTQTTDAEVHELLARARALT